jgi:hypothetical protein
MSFHLQSFRLQTTCVWSFFTIYSDNSMSFRLQTSCVQSFFTIYSDNRMSFHLRSFCLQSFFSQSYQKVSIISSPDTLPTFILSHVIHFIQKATCHFISHFVYRGFLTLIWQQQWHFICCHFVSRHLSTVILSYFLTPYSDDNMSFHLKSFHLESFLQQTSTNILYKVILQLLFSF